MRTSAYKLNAVVATAVGWEAHNYATNRSK